ncbi:RNA-binding protein [Plasmodium cynomolgi strain B]|uniref:RNA-binding protein n=1 Tax=Plasmodium cynomolgi (strain B) TaxID=1120755 RepID=K6UCH6_PLACD|nr:RNA-binding protein [Plasmodium cynomolgi strain B]GAB64866.1 RNA-binding protein [Plasmodium cynomolgi strain B]
MWLKNIYSKSEGGEKNMGGQEDAIDYDEEEQHRRGGAAADAAEDYAGAAANGRDANGEESAHKREDASDEGECPMDDAQINEQIENIIKNMSSDEEEEGEVVEDEIPYDRIEASNELNKEVILLNFYSDMSNQRLTSLMSVFGKVRNSFIDDNEGVHVIFNSVKSSKRAKEFLDNLKIKNRRIQVIYGTYQERRNDPCMVGASVPGEDITDGVVGEGGIGDDVHGTGQMEGTPNDISTSSHHEKLRTHKNGRTPVKLYKNRKYYLNTVPTNAQNSVAANFTYNSHAKGMVPHVKTNAYFVAPSSSSYRLNGFVSASEMSFSQQEKAPTDNHLHSSTRGGNPNKHHHMPPYNNTFYRPHASNNQHHGGKTSYGNLASSEDYPTPHALYSNYEEYTPHGAHGAHAGHAGHVSHSAHTVKPPKLAKYSKTVKHSRNQNPLLASEREANQIDESVEYIPFNEDNPFGISEENKMLDNPTWNDRKIKQVLQWDQGASIEKNHLDFVDSFGSTKIFNRYLLVTDFPDHLDDENKVKEYMNELFSSEKLHRICVEVSLFVPIEVDEERFFKNATKAEEEEGAVNQGEDDTVNQGEEGAVNQGEEGVVNQGEEGVVNQGEEGAVNQGEQDAPIQGEEAKPEDAPKGAKRRGAKKAAAPKQRKKRGKAKEEEEEQQQQQAAQVGEAHEAGAADQADQTEQADQAGQAGAAEQGNNPPADAARGKRYAHLTFRTIKNCVQAKKALEKNQIKVTFSVPNKANVCLWIGNVLKNFFINTANILKSMFMHFGGLKNIKYVQDKNCIFLQYFTVTDAIKARNHMYGLQVSNNTMLNIDYSTLGEWEGKQHKVSVTRKRLLDALAYDNGKMKEKLESTLRMRNPGFIDPKVMLLLKNGDSHGSNTAGGGAAGGAAGGGVRIKRHATDKSDEHNLKRRPTWDENYLPSTSMHRRKHRSSVIDSYPTSNSANDRTRERGGHSRHDKRESKRSSKRKGATTSDYSPHHHHSNHNNSHSNHNNSHSNHNNSHSNHNNNHNNHHNHRHHDHHHRRHKKRRSGNSGSGDGGDAAGYISRGEEGDSTSEITKSATNRDHAEEEIDSDFNSLDGVELNDYNEIQKTVSFYVNQKYKCDFISNFYDGNPELKM